MIKRALYAIVAVVALTLVGCGQKRIIPDDTLADIFHDAFVVNAYIGEERINLDTLQIYEPIFNHYGYTSADVMHTVGNFSRRKSARLGTVVEQAISRLEKESKMHAAEVVILDTIKNVAVRTFTRVIYQDSLIRAQKRADSVNLQVLIMPVSKGEYTINYSYKCEGDIDKNPRRAEFYFEDADGYRHSYASVALRSFGTINRTIIANDSDVRLVLKLGDFDKKVKRYPKDNSIFIRKLRVTRRLREEEAIDSLFKKYVDVKIFADGFPYKTDSLTLSADSTRVSTSTPHND